MLNVSHLYKSFGSNLILRDINLHVTKGKRIVIQGPSGCGKTTLLRCIAGLESYDRGSITLDGRKVSDPENIIPPFKRDVGMVFQDLALWPHMSVYQNVAFNLNKIIPDKRKLDEEVINILTRLHIEHKAGESVLKISGGEKQRVAIARTMVRRPKILLMDEPFSNLDRRLKQVLIKLLIDLQQQFLTTLIYVTHDYDVVEQLADEMIMMERGHVIESEIVK